MLNTQFFESIHCPVEKVETHLCRADGDFFLCRVEGNKTEWISRIQLLNDPFTSKDRDIVDEYCITYRIPPISQLSYVDMDILENETTSKPAIQSKRKCCDLSCSIQ